jgi:hypothetical protein
MNETHKVMIIELAKSFTEEIYQKGLETIAAINSSWAEWLYEGRKQYVCAFFLNDGYCRWGKVTSNAVESINGFFGEACSFLIVYLIEHMVKYQREKYHTHYLQACKWRDERTRITEYAQRLQVDIADEAAKRQVEILE